MRFVLRRLSVVLLAVVAVSAVAVSSAWASGKPVVETKRASSVFETKAVLHGEVNPNGAETKYYFEYGHTTSYGQKTSEVSVGSGTESQEVSRIVKGLSLGEGKTIREKATYHFRIVATNSNGTGTGADKEFLISGKEGEGPCPVTLEGGKTGLCVRNNSESPYHSESSAAAEWATIKGPEPLLEVTNGGFWYGSPIDCGSLSAKSAEFRTSSGSLALNQGSVLMTECDADGTVGEKCEMPSNKSWYETSGSFGGPESFRVTNVQGESRALFEFELKQRKECPSAWLGSNVLHGGYTCKVHEAEVPATSHKIVCEGTKMEFRGGYLANLRYEASLALAGADAGKEFVFYEHS